MGLSEHGRLIVQCVIDLLNVKEELFELASEQPSGERQSRMALLDKRKYQLLNRVTELGNASTHRLEA
jgi:hypothetical protein